MRNAKGVPENDILVDDVLGRIGSDPGGEALFDLAGGLRNVPASRMDLGVVV
jgi:hypothetical protein